MMRFRGAAPALCLAGILWAGAAPSGAAEAPVGVRIEEPREGARVLGGEPVVYVRGTARARGGAVAGHDVMLIIDTSGSTAGPSGAGATRNGPPASILTVEVAAAEALLTRLDPAATRVGVVTFDGPVAADPVGGAARDAPAAVVAQPLTADFEQVRAALRRVLEAGPAGGTDLAAGIRLAVRELLALRGSASPADPGRRKVALLLTDGKPTLPFGRGRGDRVDPRDVELAAHAARVAAVGGVTIHTFGLGPDAVAAPEACATVAEATGGRYVPLRNPAQVLEALPRISLAGVELIAVRNLTAGRFAGDVAMTAEGSFRAAVPLVRGANQIEVSVLAEGGREGRAQVTVHHVPPRRLDVEIFRERDLPRDRP